MLWLLLASLLWAFSFGLYKRHLAGLDPQMVAAVRLGLAMLVFLPTMRGRGLRPLDRLALTAIGGVQFGAMYLAYNTSFRYLEGWEVALFTIFTPLYIILLDRRRAGRPWTPYVVWGSLWLALLGAGLVQYHAGHWWNSWVGFGWVQAANLCFAAGQLAYREWLPRLTEKGAERFFFWPLAGGFLLSGLAASVSGGWSQLAHLTLAQGLALGYLGFVASGIGFFWWNRGVTQTTTPSLAVFNNLKIPLAVAVSLLVFREPAHLGRLLLGSGLLLGALWWANRPR